MRKGLLLGALLGTLLSIGVPPLVQAIWEKSWGYLGGGTVTVTEPEILRSVIITVILVVVGCFVYWWGGKEDRRNTDAIKVAFKEAVRELREEWRKEQNNSQPKDVASNSVNHKKPEDTDVNQ
ncbi:MAG: hypothetical protein PHN78_09185 [Dehalococcoidales bacterium]|nr:hypothetical protein [Dehalococcoidales bacterium]